MHARPAYVGADGAPQDIPSAFCCRFCCPYQGATRGLSSHRAAAAGSREPDWAAKFREEILATAAADAKAAAEEGGLAQIKDLQAMIDELLESRRAQEAEIAIGRAERVHSKPGVLAAQKLYS